MRTFDGAGTFDIGHLAVKDNRHPEIQRSYGISNRLGCR
jgi:hypothetical protein